MLSIFGRNTLSGRFPNAAREGSAASVVAEVEEGAAVGEAAEPTEAIEVQ